MYSKCSCFVFVWCPCMAINVSVQHNDGFLPGISAVDPMLLPSENPMLRRSGCVHIFLQTYTMAGLRRVQPAPSAPDSSVSHNVFPGLFLLLLIYLDIMYFHQHYSACGAYFDVEYRDYKLEQPQKSTVPPLFL